MANRDLDELFHILMPHAVDKLCFFGHFQPFGATVNSSGEITPNVAHIGGSNKPNRKQVDKLVKAYQKLASERRIRALGVCKQVPLNNAAFDTTGTAINCCLEHANGDVIDLYIPFNINRATNSITFGSLCARQKPGDFFN